MSDGPPSISGGLLGLLPTELLQAILSETDENPEKLTSYDLVVALRMSCRHWKSVEQQERLCSTVASVALRSPAAVRAFALEKHLPNLKKLFIVSTNLNKAASYDLERSWTNLSIIIGLYSPQLELFSWLWYSQAMRAPAIPFHHFASFSWPKLKTLEARLGRINTTGSSYTEHVFSQSDKSMKLMFSTMPQLRVLRVSIICTENIVSAMRSAVDSHAGQLEELIVKVIEDPTSAKFGENIPVLDAEPESSALVYENFNPDDFPKLRCFASTHLPLALSEAVIQAKEPLRGNIWSISEHNSAIAVFLHHFGLYFPSSTTKLPDLNFIPERLCPRGALLPIISWVQSSTISLDDLNALVGFGADPFARSVLPISSASLHGNLFTYALLDPKKEQPFQLLFQTPDSTGVTFFQKALSKVDPHLKNVSVCPTGEVSILLTIAEHFFVSFEKLESRIEWMIRNSTLLNIDLNARNDKGQAFVHLCHTERLFVALKQSGQCDCDALDGQGRDALECAISARFFSLSSHIYQRRLSSGAALPLRTFYAVVDVAYQRLRNGSSSDDPEENQNRKVETEAWVKLAESMYHDSTASKRLAPIDQLDPERIKAFARVFGTAENGRSKPWSQSAYRIGETLFEAILRIAMGRMMAANGLRCLMALLDDLATNVDGLVSPSKSGYTPLHLLAESDLCSLIDDEETERLFTLLIDRILKEGVDPEAEAPPTQHTALQIALEKTTFPPTARALNVFLSRLLGTGESLAIGSAQNETFHEPGDAQAPGRMFLTDQFFERGATVTAQYSGSSYSHVPEGHDGDEELRMALLLSLQESQGSGGTAALPPASQSVDQASINPSMYDPEHLEYDEDEMLTRALALSLEMSKLDDNNDHKQTDDDDSDLDDVDI